MTTNSRMSVIRNVSVRPIRKMILFYLGRVLLRIFKKLRWNLNDKIVCRGMLVVDYLTVAGDKSAVTKGTKRSSL